MSHTPDPLDGISHESGPGWVSVLQAGVFGVLAGLVLNGFLSMASVSGESINPAPAPARKECKKKNPPKGESAPTLDSTLGGWHQSLTAES